MSESEAQGTILVGRQAIQDLIQRHEGIVDNAQHRVVKELSVSMLEMLHDVDHRLLINKSMVGSLDSMAMRGAIREIMDYFDERLCRIVGEVDAKVQQLIGAYADMEEYTALSESRRAEAQALSRSFFGRTKALRAMEEAVDASQRVEKAAEQIVQLRQEITARERSIRAGQQRILAMVEEVMAKHAQPNTQSLADQSQVA